ncbi:hypothetical protein [Burkholderia humptydooensis]|uniref:hypothetical protein n=1 Tax=Burkholderia humptydooensis TaxID=430531 RepID=UPI0010FCEEE9|nr:hypothetical protein [Burkholderia humptydooensis]
METKRLSRKERVAAYKTKMIQSSRIAAERNVLRAAEVKAAESRAVFAESVSDLSRAASRIGVVRNSGVRVGRSGYSVPVMTQDPHVRFSPPTQREIDGIQAAKTREAASRKQRREEAERSWPQQAADWDRHLTAHNGKTFKAFGTEAR